GAAGAPSSTSPASSTNRAEPLTFSLTYCAQPRRNAIDSRASPSGLAPKKRHGRRATQPARSRVWRMKPRVSAGRPRQSQLPASGEIELEDSARLKRLPSSDACFFRGLWHDCHVKRRTHALSKSLPTDRRRAEPGPRTPGDGVGDRNVE